MTNLIIDHLTSALRRGIVNGPPPMSKVEQHAGDESWEFCEDQALQWMTKAEKMRKSGVTAASETLRRKGI